MTFQKFKKIFSTKIFNCNAILTDILCKHFKKIYVAKFVSRWYDWHS